jgi:hypothetical protein
VTTADGTVIGTTQIASSGSPSNRWNLVLLSDGYQAAGLPTYHQHARDFVTALFATPPFDALCGAINVYRVDVASTDSGTDDPATCADGSTGSGASPRTYFDSTVCSWGIRRLLTVNTSVARATAQAEVPQTTRVVVLVNTTLYGGSGGTPVGAFAAAFSPVSTAHQVAIHELGHTGFYLADEYGGCTPGAGNRYSDPEPDQPNVTTIIDRATTKWRTLIASTTPLPTQSISNCGDCAVPPSPAPPGTVGLFEDAFYAHCGIYRPEYDCKMRGAAALGIPFCAVCRARITAVLSAYNAPEPTTPLRLVDVGAPEINTWFDPAASVVVSDTAPDLTLVGTSGPGFVQSRLIPQGLSGTGAAGLFGYEFRIDMTGSSSTGATVGVSRLEVDVGPISPLAYAGTGPADIYVVTHGGLGNVHPTAAERTSAGRLVLQFSPAVNTGDTSYFMGFASLHPPREVAVRVIDTAGRCYDVEGRAPAAA